MYTHNDFTVGSLKELRIVYYYFHYGQWAALLIICEDLFNLVEYIWYVTQLREYSHYSVFSFTTREITSCKKRKKIEVGVESWLWTSQFRSQDTTEFNWPLVVSVSRIFGIIHENKSFKGTFLITHVTGRT